MFGFGVQLGSAGVRQQKASLNREPKRSSRDPFAKGGTEPSVEDLINDPVTMAIMAYDNVTPAALRSLVDHVRPALRQRRSIASPTH